MTSGSAGGRAAGSAARAPARAPSDPPAPPSPPADARFAALDQSLRRARYAQDHLIELLHVAQDVFGHLDDDVLAYLARELRLPQSRVYGVATFYHLFTFEPSGDHACVVCTGTACFVKGADDIVGALSQRYGLAPGQTAGDGSLTLSTARCLGSCGLAPVVVVDGVVRGHATGPDVVAAVAAVLEPAGAVP